MDEQRTTLQRTFRFPTNLDNDVMALAHEGETTTSTYSRVLRAGISAIRGDPSSFSGTRAYRASNETTDALITTLREQLEHERNQLEHCRRQLDTMMNLLSQEQSLRLVESKRTDDEQRYEDDEESDDDESDHGGAAPASAPTTTDSAEAHGDVVSQNSAKPLTLGRALRLWFNGTPVNEGH